MKHIDGSIMIVLPNIDGKIWNIEYKIVDIIKELVTNGFVILSLNGEGPDAEVLGLYHILDLITEKYGILKNAVTIHTSNQLETHSHYSIVKHPPLYILETQQFYHKNKLSNLKMFSDKFFNIGIFIGRSNWVRLWLAGHLHNIASNSVLMTYHWQLDHEFHDVHNGLDDMLQWGATINNINNAVHLLSACPIKVDTVDQYPVLSPEHLNICKVYQDFFAEIVCETYFSGKTFYPTEKIWRPLIMKTPFIVHGPVDYLKNLKLLGFKTFNRWWSEEYDDYGHNLRIEKILKIIDNIKNMPTDKIMQMHTDMAEILEHNFQQFMSLSPNKFSKIFK